MKNILVYSGPGTERVEVLISSLKAALNHFGVEHHYQISRTHADRLYDKEWIRTTTLLVIPGGRDLPYTASLTGDTLVNIRDFIRTGGSYLGLCAGAYFSCSQVVFEKGTKMEVIGSRELNLFQGTARGSVFHPFVYNSTLGSRVVTLRAKDRCGVERESHAYFNGGCEFIPKEGFTDFCTRAVYNDEEYVASKDSSLSSMEGRSMETLGRKAVVSLSLGEGRVLLSGVHPEMDTKYLKREEYSNEQWKAMLKYQDVQRELMRDFVAFLLQCNSNSKSKM